MKERINHANGAHLTHHWPAIFCSRVSSMFGLPVTDWKLTAKIDAATLVEVFLHRKVIIS